MTTPTFDSVVFPIAVASIVGAVLVAVGTVLMVAFAVTIGFELVKRLADYVVAGVAGEQPARFETRERFRFGS